MKDKISLKFNELSNYGQRLVDQIKGVHPQDVLDYISKDENTYMEWLSSSANLLAHIAPSTSHYIENSRKILNDVSKRKMIDDSDVLQMYGLLTSAKKEWIDGLLGQIEYIVAADTFDDFLDHAYGYYRAGLKIESAVLASAVLEDTIKKIARKNSISIDQSLDPLVDKMVKSGIFLTNKGKRIKAYVGTRNSALHARWDEIDIKDVGVLIAGIRELIDDYLTSNNLSYVIN